jgi:hypothetical protein
VVRTWNRRIVWAAAALAGVAGLGPTTESTAQAQQPSARLISVLTHVDAIRFAGDGELQIMPGVYLAASGGAFEIDATRHAGKVTLWQVQRTGGEVKRIRRIHPTRAVHLTDGIPDFFTAVLHDAHGHRMGGGSSPFCGGASEPARVAASGPDAPTYPQLCGTRLTRDLVIGVDRGWSLPLDVAVPLPGKAPDGRYELTLRINPAYAKQLKIVHADAVATVRLDVTTATDGGCEPGPCPAQRTRVVAGRPVAPDRTPLVNLAGAGGVPDLRALPAHDLSTQHHGHRDYLDFGATIWNAGSGPLVLEGFRRGTSDTMSARQFIYRNGRAISSLPVGRLEFDKRKGHNHWHLEDVARYDLLDANGRRVVLSGKQSFCLAPTDPIDLTVRGADWLAEQAQLSSSCGGEEAIWLREVLQAGWGDTYYQDVAGQSFDVTGLPNGRYQVRVAADPHHRLKETSYRNNVGLRSIELGGTPGHRTVTVVH